VLDSVLDRYVESALLAGLSWYYRDSWVLAPCLFALVGSLLVPYVRARGEALGAEVKDTGFFQRPERVALLSAGTALSPILEVVLDPGNPAPPHRLAIAAVLLVGVGAHVTVVQRLVALLRDFDQRAPGPSLGAPTRSAASNVAATVVDFACAAVLVHEIRLDPSLATAVGCAIGAVTAFLLARSWAFDASAGTVMHQAARYAGVSLVTLVLNAGGVALLLLLDLPFVAAWCVARSVIFAAWSYPLQRDFVFAAGEGLSAHPRITQQPSSVSPH
jgi:putative flippase GtrA